MSRAIVVLSAAVALHTWLDTAHLQQALPNPDRPRTMAAAGGLPAAVPVLFSAPGRTAAETVRLTVEEVIAHPVRTFEAMAAGAMRLAESAVGTNGVLAASRGPDAAAVFAPPDFAAVATLVDDRPPDVLQADDPPADAPALLAVAAPLSPLERPRSAVEVVFSALPRPASRRPAAGLEVPSATADTTARERQIILDIVNAYSQAFERLDVRAAKAVSPSIDDRRLQKAFARLEGQKLRFEDCRLSIEGAAANARCLAHGSFTPKIGSRVIHLTGQQWTFNFSQSESGWQIVKTTIDKPTLH